MIMKKMMLAAPIVTIISTPQKTWKITIFPQLMMNVETMFHITIIIIKDMIAKSAKKVSLLNMDWQSMFITNTPRKRNSNAMIAIEVSFSNKICFFIANVLIVGNL